MGGAATSFHAMWENSKDQNRQNKKKKEKSHDVSPLYPTDPHQLYVILQSTRLFMGSVVWNKYGHIEWRGAH